MFEHSVPTKWDDDDDDDDDEDEDEDEGSANQIFKGSANLPTQCSCVHTASLPRVANLQRVAIQGRVQSRMRRARGELGDFKEHRLGFHGISQDSGFDRHKHSYHQRFKDDNLSGRKEMNRRSRHI